MSAGAVPGRWRLLAPALGAWAVIAAALPHPGAAGRIALLSAIAGIAVIVAAGLLPAMRRGTFARPARALAVAGRSLPRAGSLGAALLACAVLVLIGSRAELLEWRRADPQLTAAAERASATTFSGELRSFPESAASDFGTRSWVRAELDQPRGPVPVLLWLDEEPGEHWAPGMRIAGVGVPERLGPGDAAAFAVSVDALRVMPTGGWSERFGALAAGLRSGLRDAAARIPGAELVPGFAVGDTSLVGDELAAAMLESSLTHLTAVSGANCALVTGGVLWLLARAGAGRRLRVAAAGGALAGFVGIVGPDASVQRAAVMAAVVLGSGFGGKRAAAFPSLGLAVIVLLLFDPWQSLQPGFALSVLATGGILLAASPWGDAMQRRLFLPRPIAVTVAVALAAQAACGPVLLLLQPGIPAAGIVANTLAAPAAPLGTALGLLAALVLPIAPQLGQMLVWAASLPARWIAATATVLADPPIGRWHWPEGWGGALLLALCEGLLLVGWALWRGYLGMPGGIRVERRLAWGDAVPVPLAVRVAAASVIGLGAGIAVAVTLAVPVAARLGTPDDWAVVACDVGQGDALLLRDPAVPDEVMLVDTGDDPELVIACLDRFGVREISLLVLTHDDRDHVGALDAVVGRTRSALIAPDTADDVGGAERQVVRELAAAGVETRIGTAGARGGLGARSGVEAEGAEAVGADEGLVWRVLAPAAESLAVDRNAGSLVLRVDAGPVRVLLLADTGLEEQRALRSALTNGAGVDAGGVDSGGADSGGVDSAGTDQLRAHVLKVAHHGSGDQDPDLPATVGAEWALISVGAGNGYGHPAADTLAELARAGTRVLRTDRHGSIALVPDSGGAVRPWVEGGEIRTS